MTSLLLGVGIYYHNHSFIGFYVAGVLYVLYNLPAFLLFTSYWKEDANKIISIDSQQRVMWVRKGEQEKHIRFEEVQQVILHKSRHRQASTFNNFFYFQLDINGGQHLMLTSLLIEEDKLPFVIAFVKQEVEWEIKHFDYLSYQQAVKEKQIQLYEKDIQQFREKFQHHTLQELKVISTDEKFVSAAVEAARALIQEKEHSS
jgi:hypothetical protein